MFKTCDWNKNEQMGGAWDNLIASVNTPATKAAVQKAIDDTKQKAIDAAIKAGTNAAGNLLQKTGAVDPKNQAAIDLAIKNTLSAAQKSFFEKNKMLIYGAAGLVGVSIIALVAMKVMKK